MLSPLGRFVFFALAVPLLFTTGCSSPAASAPTSLEIPKESHHAADGAHEEGWISPEAAGQKLLYVSQMGADNVLVYKLGRHIKQVGLLRALISGPEDVWVDSKLNVYVVNQGGNRVLEFRPLQTTPIFTYRCPSTCEPGAISLSVAVDENGTVYEGTTNGIYEFHQGNPIPFQLLTQESRPYGLALDRSGNLYATGQYDVLEFAPGGTSGTPLGLHGIVNPTGLAFDGSGDLVATTELAERTRLRFFKSGQTRAFFKTRRVNGSSYQLALDRQGTLYAPVANVSSGMGTIVTYSPGQSKASTLIKNLRSPQGLAISPPAPLGISR